MDTPTNVKMLTDKFPWLDKRPVSVDLIRDPSIFEQEKQLIFRKGWLLAGRVERIPNAPQPQQTLHAYLGGLGEALAGYPFERGTTRAQFTCTIKSNWKNVVDSFCL